MSLSGYISKVFPLQTMAFLECSMKKKNGPDQFNKTHKKKIKKKHALLKQSLKQNDSIICHQMT